MRQQLRTLVIGLGAAAIAALPAGASAQDRERPERINGHPNLNGIWQAIGSAHWNLEAHPAEAPAGSAAIAAAPRPITRVLSC